MARLSLFSFTSSISNESVSAADDKNVTVDTSKELPPQVKEDTDGVEVDKDVSAQSPNTKTMEPGPKDGGGDGTADFQSAEKSQVGIKIADVDPKIAHDQQGGRHVDELPRKVNAKDNLSARDVSTSVENHDEESGIKSIDTGGAECVGEADDLIVDMDQEDLEVVGMTDATDKGVSNADAEFAKVDELNKGIASIERYVGLLDRMDQAGRALTPELRQSISWALEHIDAELFFEERVALESFDPSARVSMEANDMVVAGQRTSDGVIDDGEDPGSVGKGLSGKLKQLIQAAIRLFRRAANAVVDTYHALTSDMPKIRQHLSDLRGKVRVLDGGTNFQMNGAHRLMVGDEFVGDSREAVNRVSKVAHELLLAWPNQLGKLMKDWEEGRSGMFGAMLGRTDEANYSKMIDGVSDLMDRSFRNLQDLSTNDRSKVPSGFLDSTRVQWSGPLPGNRALYTGVNQDLEGVGASNIGKSVQINFSAIPGEEVSSGPIDVESLSGGEAMILIRELEKLTHFIDDAKKGMAEIRKLAGDVKEDGSNDLFYGAITGSEAKALAGIMVLNIAGASTNAQNQFFGYLTGMIKGYMGYMMASLKAEGGNTVEGEKAA